VTAPLVVITPTGGRPKSFALLCEYVRRQTYGGLVRWIVVDDCDPATAMPADLPPNWRLEHVRPAHRWQPGANTQRKNLRVALRKVRHDDRVTVFEDDEHYAPGWLEALAAALERRELVGQSLCRKYNVRHRRAGELVNQSRASLCCTGFRGQALVKFRELCISGPAILDGPLWKSTVTKAMIKGAYVTGLKGLPGRGGIDSGHRPDFGSSRDPDGDLLRKWIGKDAEAYLDMTPHKRDEEIKQYVRAYKSPAYAMGRRRRDSVREVLAALGGGTLLDVGTGRGETLRYARELGIKATGTEVVPYLLNERVVYAQAHALPHADSSVDHVTCFDVLEHLTEEDIRPALREMLRVARKTVTVSASERSDVRQGRELHISKRPAAEWLRVISECWPGARQIGLAGASPLFRAEKQ